MDTLSRLSHDADGDVSQAAILGLGLLGAGTNNARLAGLLRGLSSYHCKDPAALFLVRVAQGFAHMGKGLLGLSPYHTDRQLLSGARARARARASELAGRGGKGEARRVVVRRAPREGAPAAAASRLLTRPSCPLPPSKPPPTKRARAVSALSGLLALLFPALDLRATVGGRHPTLLFCVATAMRPRMLMTVDEARVFESFKNRGFFFFKSPSRPRRALIARVHARRCSPPPPPPCVSPPLLTPCTPTPA